MAYSAFTDAQIAIGQANKKELWQKVKDNDDDHESRISDNAAGVASTFPIEFIVRDSGVVSDAVSYVRVSSNITINSAIVTVMQAGTSGTLEVDIQGKEGVGAFATILSGGNISVAFGAGDFASSSAAGFATTDFDTGDFLRIDLKTVQVGMRDAVVTIGYTFRS